MFHRRINMETIKTFVCFLCMFVAGGLVVYLYDIGRCPVTTKKSLPVPAKSAHFSIVTEKNTLKIYIDGKEQIHYIPKSRKSDYTVSFYYPRVVESQVLYYESDSLVKDSKPQACRCNSQSSAE